MALRIEVEGDLSAAMNELLNHDLKMVIPASKKFNLCFKN